MWINLSDDEIGDIRNAVVLDPTLSTLVERISKEKLTWIPNLGDEPAAGTLVDVVFRHGDIATNCLAQEWYWPIDGGDCDIVAYRLTP